MSYQSAAEPICRGITGSIELVIESTEADLGGFSVRRALPSRDRRMVGPFIFFDHAGPAEFPPGEGVQVRPHPHIGLATVAYLFEGEITHRDSQGFVQPVQPGTLNLMTAGRGITHSERAPENLKASTRFHGMQTWIALPDSEEDCAPTFDHYSSSEIPELDIEGVTVRLLIGEAYGTTSPVKAYSRTLYLECRLPGGLELSLPDDYREMAVYVVSGDVQFDERTYTDGVMVVACPGKSVQMKARKNSHVMVIGGDPIGHRHIWWNFVASSKERIEKAKTDWKEGRFDNIPGESEFIPLPE